LTLGFAAVWALSAADHDAFMDRDYGQWSAKMQMLKRCDAGDVAVFGDSRASAAFLPSSFLPLKVRNLALTGATPIEAYYEWRQLERCADPPKVLVLSFSATQFETAPWFWSHAARYGFFSLQDLEEIRKTEAALGQKGLYQGAFGSEPPARVKNFLYASSFPPFNFASMMAAGGVLRRRANAEARLQTLKTGGQHLEGQAPCARAPTPEVEEADFKPSPLLSYYLDRLLTEAAQRGVKVVLLTPAVSDLTFARLQPRFEQAFSAYLQRVERAHPQTETVNPATWAMPACAFGDDFHLNQTGAETFSSQMAPALRAAAARDALGDARRADRGSQANSPPQSLRSL
jgi:hypothetical protein